MYFDHIHSFQPTLSFPPKSLSPNFTCFLKNLLITHRVKFVLSAHVWEEGQPLGRGSFASSHFSKESDCPSPSSQPLPLALWTGMEEPWKSLSLGASRFKRLDPVWIVCR